MMRKTFTFNSLESGNFQPPFSCFLTEYFPTTRYFGKLKLQRGTMMQSPFLSRLRSRAPNHFGVENQVGIPQRPISPAAATVARGGLRNPSSGEIITPIRSICMHIARSAA